MVPTVQVNPLAGGAQSVIARTTQQAVVARQRLRGQCVIACTTVEHVGALVVRQRVIAIAAIQAVVAKVAFDLVVAITTA